MNITLTEAPLAGQSVDGGIVLTFGRDLLMPRPATSRDKQLAQLAEAWIKRHRFRGDSNQVAIIPIGEALPLEHLILVGLGKPEEFNVQRLQRAVAAGVRAARKQNLHRLATPLGLRSRDLPCSEQTFVSAVAVGAHVGRYQFRTYRSESSRGERSPRLLFTNASQDRRSQRKALQRGNVVGEAVCDTRDLANLGGNAATPEHIAAAARALAKKHRLTCTVWGRSELSRRKCHAMLSVAEGSRRDAKLITLKIPGSRKGLKPLVLVGKTITFDTGGISLKPPRSMEWMKYDKCGGMAVFAAVQALAQLKPPCPVIGILAAAENMPGGGATRPGDVVRAHSGKTIEIINTDAEGRLVLADALSVAAQFKPEAIIDLATLTGAVVTALGSAMAGIMGNDEGLIDRLRAAGDASGDRVWPLPLLPEHREALASPFADLKNVGGPSAGALTAGAFLQAFVPHGVPWAHVDIAGTAWEESARPYADAGATLFGTQLLVEWVMGPVSKKGT